MARRMPRRPPRSRLVIRWASFRTRRRFRWSQRICSCAGSTVSPATSSPPTRRLRRKLSISSTTPGPNVKVSVPRTSSWTAGRSIACRACSTPSGSSRKGLRNTPGIRSRSDSISGRKSSLSATSTRMSGGASSYSRSTSRSRSGAPRSRASSRAVARSRMWAGTRPRTRSASWSTNASSFPSPRRRMTVNSSSN